MPSLLTATPAVPVPQPRIRVFVDYWNLQLTMNERVSKHANQPNSRFLIDWAKLPAWLAQKASEFANIPIFRFDGGIIYSSYDPNKAEGRKFNNWATTWLNRQPGIQVVNSARHPKNPPTCQTCHRTVANCPHPQCGAALAGTVEKGVDIAIVTDMIRLAWEGAYDIAVLASSDADLVPAVKFLNQKGHRVIQAGFPPSGVNLATACWASFDMFKLRHEIERS